MPAKLILSLFLCGCVASEVLSAEVAPMPRERLLPATTQAANSALLEKAQPQRLPISQLMPAVLLPNICVYTYPTATANELCRAHCDMAYGYYYSYMYMEAARSFETALQYDPDCVQAWLGLHLAMVKWGRSRSTPAGPFLAVGGAVFQGKLPECYEFNAADYPLMMAKRLMKRAPHRTQLLVQAKLQERGYWPDTPAEQRKAKAMATLDELLAIYPTDEEAWFARAQIAEGRYGGAPFYQALLKLNPLHPGAHHELVHFYENIGRPALGWPHALGYMDSSPGIAHAFHMQAHLGMRIGKWGETTEYSIKAIELQHAYHQALNVKPSEDQQYSHHLEILTKSLLHDGRFDEATALLDMAKSKGIRLQNEQFRLALETRNWEAAQSLIVAQRKTNKEAAAYRAALIALAQGDIARAKAEWETLRQVAKKSTTSQLQLWEIQGRIMCLSGQGEAGSQLLKRAVDKTKNDYRFHAWAGGSYYMEAWGLGSLDAGRAEDAEEAFLEALAHDSGSVRAALGLWALCERLERYEESERYLALAERLWKRAKPEDFRALQVSMEQAALAIPSSAVVRSEPRRSFGSFFISKNPPVVSGVAVGKRCGPYSFLPADGPEKGKPTCYICEQEDNPTVVVFARSLNEQTAKLLQRLDAEATRREGTGYKAWMTYLTPKADLDELSQWSAKLGLKSTPIGAFEDIVGPPAYKLAAEADLTVMLFVKQKVVANFAFRSGECTPDRLAELEEALPKLFE